jgi:hypothetical protein
MVEIKVVECSAKYTVTPDTQKKRFEMTMFLANACAILMKVIH